MASNSTGTEAKSRAAARGHSTTAFARSTRATHAGTGGGGATNGGSRGRRLNPVLGLVRGGTGVVDGCVVLIRSGSSAVGGVRPERPCSGSTGNRPPSTAGELGRVLSERG